MLRTTDSALVRKALEKELSGRKIASAKQLLNRFDAWMLKRFKEYSPLHLCEGAFDVTVKCFNSQPNKESIKIVK